MSENGWSREERNVLVDGYNKAHQTLKTVSLQMDEAQGDALEALGLLADGLDRQVFQLAQAYLAGLPRQPLARCPYTDHVARLSLDPFGLDGMFWECDEPARPEHETDAGPHFLSLTGAVRLAEAVEPTSFIVCPGPGVPFVIPRLFEGQEVIGVLSAGHVGAHLAFAVTYFAAHPHTHLHRPNLWGTEVKSLSAAPSDPDGVETVRDYDFDLRPWIEKGCLAWLKPGDADLNLHFDVDDCPFLDLPGERQVQYMQYGEAWT